MSLVGARQPRLGEGSCSGRARRPGWIAVAAAVASLFVAAAAVAAPLPGTPITVAPGVPGHGRAWELVSPSDPVSAPIYDVKFVSPAGDRVIFTAVGPLPGATAGTPATASLASRGADGWSSRPLAFPNPAAYFSNVFRIQMEGPRLFDPSFSTSLWINSLPKLPGQAVADVGLFYGDAGGGYELLVNMGREGQFVAASEDFQRVLFWGEGHLLPSDAARTTGGSLYELAGSTLRQLDLDDDGSLLSSCGSTVFAPGAIEPQAGAISDDLDRVFFVSRGADCSGQLRVYLREGAETTEISASQCARADCTGPRDVRFAGATPSGSTAFLVTDQQLTDDDVDTVSDLYRYEVGSGELSRVSSPRTDEPPSLGVPRETVAAAEDGSRLYFTFAGRLLPDLGTNATAHFNTYLWDEAGLHYVASSTFDTVASADARYAAFATSTPLEPGDENEGADVYRYDAADHSLIRLSTPAPGGADDGGTSFDPVLAAGGRVVYFSSTSPLLPEDRNDAIDLYEWRDGRLGLISPGAPGIPASFMGASADGSTVLFKTTATLLPADRDGGDADIYAARLGGGFAEPGPPPGCEGEACRGASAAPLDRPALRPVAGGGIDLAPIGASARRRIAASGRIALGLEVPAAGRVLARARARIEGRSRAVARGSAEAAHAGPVWLSLPLSRAARRALGAGETLRLRLTVRLAGTELTRTVRFALRGRA